MIRLNQSESQVLSVITAQNGANVTVAFLDKTASGDAEGSQLTNIITATTTTVAASPEVGTARDIDYIGIRSTFAGTHAITVQISSSAVLYPMVNASLLISEVLQYTDAGGWRTLDANGRLKTSPIIV